MTTFATIGFFDGVHRGHQFLISRLAAMAHERGMESLVITFDRHPRQVVHADYVPQLITPLDEKLRLLAATDADRVATLHFDAQMARLSARDFMLEVLRHRYDVGALMTGYDNRFGHNRAEGFDDYVAYGREMGIEVVSNPPVDVDGMRVSSSLVRRLLSAGDVAEANVCLGHAFAIEGRVEHGYEEGRRLGFPTANIARPSDEQILPKAGVYLARASIGGGWMKAVLNVGDNPTFQRRHTTIEAHIINFDGDIYGRHIRVELLRRLRDERRFGSVELLQRQLQADCAEAADEDICQQF